MTKEVDGLNIPGGILVRHRTADGKTSVQRVPGAQILEDGSVAFEIPSQEFIRRTEQGTIPDTDAQDGSPWSENSTSITAEEELMSLGLFRDSGTTTVPDDVFATPTDKQAIVDPTMPVRRPTPTLTDQHPQVLVQPTPMPAKSPTERDSKKPVPPPAGADKEPVVDPTMPTLLPQVPDQESAADPTKPTLIPSPGPIDPED